MTHNPSRGEQRAAAILEAAGSSHDLGWETIVTAIGGAKFYKYDYDVRTFEIIDGGRMAVRGAILGSYPIEIMPGMPDEMSFTVPARIEIDLNKCTVQSKPQIETNGNVAVG